MKKFVSLCLLLAVSSMCSAERRDYGLYVGAGIGTIDTEAKDAFAKDVFFKAGEVFGGAYWKWIGIEYRTGQSLEDETVELGLDPDTGEYITAKTALTNFETIFIRLQLQNNIARIYALLGTSEVFSTSTYSDGTVDNVIGSGNAYGVGAGIYVNENIHFNLEYKSLYDTDELSLPMTSANIDFRF